jgi:PadR family transcriptional regulator PadR
MDRTVEDFMAKWESQFRKGLVEFGVLFCLEKQTSYGYELIESVARVTDMSITEGTIYPLMSRLCKADLAVAEWQNRDEGVPRKYYSLTPNGRKALKAMEKRWASVVKAMEDK